MPTQSISLTAEQVQGLTWEVYELTPDYRRSRAVFGRHPDGTPVYAFRTEVFAPDEFLEANAQQRNDNDGKRWGDDKNGVNLVKVASTPLNVWFKHFAGRVGDQDFKKWFYSREENQAFRTRRGAL